MRGGAGFGGGMFRGNWFVVQMVQLQIMKILEQAEQIVVVLTVVELPEWRRRQQMACLGCPADTRLDHLQKWYTRSGFCFNFTN